MKLGELHLSYNLNVTNCFTHLQMLKVNKSMTLLYNETLN